MATYFHPAQAPRHRASRGLVGGHVGGRAPYGCWARPRSTSRGSPAAGSGVFLQANLHPWDWYPGAALVPRRRRGGRGGRARRQPLADRRQRPRRGGSGRGDSFGAHQQAGDSGRHTGGGPGGVPPSGSLWQAFAHEWRRVTGPEFRRGGVSGHGGPGAVCFGGRQVGTEPRVRWCRSSAGTTTSTTTCGSPSRTPSTVSSIEDAMEAVDVVVLWWRDDDGDLVDGLVEAMTDLAAGGAHLVADAEDRPQRLRRRLRHRRGRRHGRPLADQRLADRPPTGRPTSWCGPSGTRR